MDRVREWLTDLRYAYMRAEIQSPKRAQFHKQTLAREMTDFRLTALCQERTGKALPLYREFAKIPAGRRLTYPQPHYTSL